MFWPDDRDDEVGMKDPGAGGGTHPDYTGKSSLVVSVATGPLQGDPGTRAKSSAPAVN